MAVAADSVVAATVIASTELDDSCTQRAAWDLGVLPVSTSELTATDVDVCRIGFGSSNGEAQLQVRQEDGAGDAMQATGSTSQRMSMLSFEDMDSVDGINYFTHDSGGSVARSDDGGATWTRMSPRTNIDDIAALGGTAAVLVADDGIVATTLDGISWTDRTSNVVEDFNAVDAADADTVYAAGDAGTIVRSDDGGVTWGAPLAVGTTENINAIDAWDDDTVFATAGSGWLLASHDGGATWDVQQHCMSSNCGLGSIFAVDDQVAWAVGGSNGQGRGYVTTDGGATWTSRPPTNGDSNGRWTDVYAWNASEIVVVSNAEGQGKVARSSDGGLSWTSDRATSMKLFSVVGRATVGDYLVSAESRSVLETTDDGATWERRYGEGTSFTAVTADGAQRAVAVGLWGEAWHSGDGGTSWTRSTPVVDEHLRAITPTATGRFVAVGDGGTIVSSDDEGATWTARSSGTTEVIKSVVATADHTRTVVAVGAAGTILRSTDDGATWGPVPSGTALSLQDVAATSSSSVESRMWAVGDSGTILRSDDRGATWAPQASGVTVYLNSVDATSPDHAVATSASRLLGTSDGSTWTQRNTSSNFSTVDAVSQDIVWWGRLSSAIRSTDGGVNAPWVANTTGSHGLHAIDSNRAIVVGSENLAWRIDPPRSIPNYQVGTASWETGPAQSMFGACLQALGGDAAVGSWAPDSAGIAGQCETDDDDPWNLVPATPTTIATTAMGDSGSVDIVWGVRTSPNQAAGHYSATIRFDVVSPSA